jgi:hypothetical protein
MYGMSALVKGANRFNILYLNSYPAKMFKNPFKIEPLYNAVTFSQT